MNARDRSLGCVLLLASFPGMCAAQKAAYETIYEDEGIQFSISGETNRQVRQLTLLGELGGKATLHLDGNVCNIDQFGERSICTEVFYKPFQVLVHPIDSQGEWRLFSLEVVDARIANYTLRLAVNKTRPESATLLLNSAFAPDATLATRLMRTVREDVAKASTLKMNQTREDETEVRTHIVKMTGLSFSPRNRIISVGDKVVWECVSGTHNAERSGASGFCTEPADRECTECENRACYLRAGEKSKPITFTQTGSFDYFCFPHKDLGMTGTITVQ